MELRGPPRGRDVPEHEVERVLNAVIDSGITLIDTSIDYGLSEERIGRHLAHRRGEFMLASKCGCIAGQDPANDHPVIPHDYSRDNIRAGVEQSLRRLRTDYLDLLQVHLSPSREELEQHRVVETLYEIQDEGMARFLGISTKLPHAFDHAEMDVFDVFQVPYSALERQHEDVIDRMAVRGAGVMVRGVLGKGVPTDVSDRRQRHWDLLESWQGLEEEVRRERMEPTEYLVRFVLGRPAVSTALIGTASADHLLENVEYVKQGALDDRP